MVLRNVASNFTFEQQRVEINELASDVNAFDTSISSGNLTLTGYLRGPAAFTIDPETHGDNTGEVVIAGNLTVNGTTTTINSTTLSVDDKIVQLGAVGTPTDATANGGGIVLKGSSDKSFLFNSTDTAWVSSLKIKSANGFEGNVTGDVTGNVTGDVTGDLTGSVLTAAQTNITSVGTLTALTVTPSSPIKITNAGEAHIDIGYSNAKYVQIGRSSGGAYQFISQEQGSGLEFGVSDASDGAGIVHMDMDRYGVVTIGHAVATLSLIHI